MAKFSMAVVALSERSLFAKAYSEGLIRKETMWEYVFEDVCNLVAILPSLAATIYQGHYDKPAAAPSAAAPPSDWAGAFVHSLGFASAPPAFADLMRLYMTIHTDHEGGNVSAHAVKLIGSALADPYLAFAAGLNGLAGPLHGLANQEVLQWIITLQQKVGAAPTDGQIKEYLWTTLRSGQVVPGYGHAVLRQTDPRYTCLREFAQTHLPNDPLVRITRQIYEIAPTVLTEHGKTKNPWPNVDAHSGVLLRHYGLVEESFYTVLFGVSRAIGTLSGLLWDRIHGLPIERPKSLTSDAIDKMFAPTMADAASSAQKSS